MATLSIEIGKKTKSSVRTISYLLIVGREKRRIPTGVHIKDSDVTPGGKIKNASIAHGVEMRMRQLQDRLNELQLELMGECVGIDYIAEHLIAKPRQLDFFDFADEWVARNKSGQAAANYKVALNSLESFLGRRVLPFHAITFSMLTKYEASLSGKPRAQSLYIGLMRHLYREAMREYNTDIEQPIKNDPFVRYRVPRQKMRKGVRSLSLEQLLSIYDWKGKDKTATMARDCFILSFSLMGMNSVDMYEAKDYSGGYIKYKRMKTRSRRTDEAYIEVKVHPIIKDMLAKYRDDKRVFDFWRRYPGGSGTFNQRINIGLKRVGKDVGIDGLQFYQARHTFATLSRNLMRFAKSDVDEALNHVGTMDIADIYIAKDFSIINDNNTKLLDKVFFSRVRVL